MNNYPVRFGKARADAPHSAAKRTMKLFAGAEWSVPQITGRYAHPPGRLRPAPASKYVQYSFA